MNIKIDINADDLIKSINNAINRLDNVVAKEVQEAGKEIEQMAKSLAPVDTGKLRNSIESSGQGMEVEVNTGDCSYAQYIEYGTYKMPPRSFMLSAFDSVTQDIDEEIADEVIKLF